MSPWCMCCIFLFQRASNNSNISGNVGVLNIVWQYSRALVGPPERLMFCILQVYSSIPSILMTSFLVVSLERLNAICPLGFLNSIEFVTLYPPSQWAAAHYCAEWTISPTSEGSSLFRFKRLTWCDPVLTTWLYSTRFSISTAFRQSLNVPEYG